MDELDFSDEAFAWAQLQNEEHRMMEAAQLAGDVGYADWLEQQVAT